MGRENEIFLLVIRRNGLRAEEVESDELIPLWEIAEGVGLRVPTVEDEIELRKVALSFGLSLVFREGEAAHRIFGDGVRQRLRQIQTIFDEWAVDVQTRRVLGDADNVAVLETEVGEEVVQLKAPFVSASSRLNACYAAGELPVLCRVRVEKDL